ncbi:hypothetical protein C1645_824737 [Glomus cerebriforme]|uniref:Galactose oxidase n=1 Tax=Glomus cerebriforme TaxID=658196 RepID=A0A397STR7_9GLOM|nr:hypothetical protein C1645_824737 [Glomus cerebriforme]
MSYSSLVCFMLWILLQVLAVEVNCQMNPFNPSVSYGHTATLIDNKLYIIGGKDANDQPVGKEFFYLDVSALINTQKAILQDLTNINTFISFPPPHWGAASVKGGAKNDELFLYGGSTDEITMELLYTFDLQNKMWSVPNISKVNAIRKFNLTGINTINKIWRSGSILNAPTPRILYGAHYLLNKNIIFMGGVDSTLTLYDTKTLNIIQGDALSLNEVYLYDTIGDNWSTKTTSGKIPSNRAAFSTVLGWDGQRIIIFGGMFNNPGYLDTTLYVLDLTNFNWYVPKIFGKIPKPRIWHQANLQGKKSYDNSVDSSILLLDISNNDEYVWATITEPNNTAQIPSLPPSPSSPSSSSSPSSPPSLYSHNSLNNTSIIVGIIIVFLLSCIGVFLYKWKNKQKIPQFPHVDPAYW